MTIEQDTLDLWDRQIATLSDLVSRPRPIERLNGLRILHRQTFGRKYA